MKKIVCLLTLPFLLFTCSFIQNTSSSYIVLDSSSLRVLEGSNINSRMLVASTAKILTAITAIENYNINEPVVIEKEDTLAIGSSVYLKENDVFKRKDLIYALMLRSANDAASALSDNDSDEFIMQMNETAKKIGMRDSVFTTASGLDEDEYNLSTAYDMALLAAYASKNNIFVEIAQTHSYTCHSLKNDYFWHNKHKLVNSDENFIWGKTGYTKKAKRILVSNYVKDNMNVIIVTINNSNDWNFHRSIINSLSKYDFISIYLKGINEIVLDKKYILIIENDVVIPVKENELEDISIVFVIYNDKAILTIYLKKEFIAKYVISVYEESNLDLDELLDLK
ncbi:MAG: D-alanyl-D-alanine carboxypeptidase family protein [Anaeroplasma sp.]